MLTSKQRAFLSAEASKREPVFQIGKEGVSDGLVRAVGEALDKRELVKLTVLKTADGTPKEVLARLCEALKAEPVCAIGSKIVLYRFSKAEGAKHIDLPEAKK